MDVNVIGQNLLRTQILLKKNEETITIVNIIFVHEQHVFNMDIRSKLMVTNK